MSILCSTIAGNSAAGSGGVLNDSLAPLALRNTIVAGNTAGGFPSDLSGTLASSGYNLIGNTQGGSGLSATDLLNVDPKLGPLQNNGGPTPTMALLASSPALNAGDPDVAGLPATDQRGAGYARVSGGRVDIGAFEV